LKKIRAMQQAQKDAQAKVASMKENVGLGISMPASTNESTVGNPRLDALRPMMAMRMPSEMTVPQQFPPSPPITPGNTNVLNTPAISRSPSSLGVENAKGDVSIVVPQTKPEEKTSAKPQAPANHTNPLAARFLPPKVPATALLGLSLLGSFDPLFPPPNQKIDHLIPSAEALPALSAKANGKAPADYDPSTFAPFEPISLGAGCRLKPGGSLLYAYTYDGQLTIVLGYDTGPMGLVNEAGKGIEGLWDGIVKGIAIWLEEGKLDPAAIEAGQKLTTSG